MIRLFYEKNRLCFRYEQANFFILVPTKANPSFPQIGRKLMIEGWEKGLLNMCVGEKRKLVVPSDLAYGSVGGFGGESINSIYPNATLVYNVELLSILDEDEAAPYLVWNLPY